MADLAQRIPALAASYQTKASAIEVRPLDFAARRSLRSRDVVFDIPINRCTETNGLTIARLGPDEWLLLGAVAASGTMEQRLNEALAGRTHSLVDISHRQVAIEVSGLRAREVLNGGCPLDLADEAFPVGSATRTLFGKAEIILIRSGAAATYRVECWRSFAPYVFGLLTEMASEFAQA
jgi:sarcosine oxidase subunit gamma